jgi:hypothetical protein
MAITINNKCSVWLNISLNWCTLLRITRQEISKGPWSRASTSLARRRSTPHRLVRQRQPPLREEAQYARHREAWAGGRRQDTAADGIRDLTVQVPVAVGGWPWGFHLPATASPIGRKEEGGDQIEVRDTQLCWATTSSFACRLLCLHPNPTPTLLQARLPNETPPLLPTIPEAPLLLPGALSSRKDRRKERAAGWFPDSLGAKL